MGQIELTVLDDGIWRFPAHYFFQDLPETEWRHDLQVDADGKIPVGHNCALVPTGQHLIVIDTGYGDDTHGGATGHMLEEFEATGRRRDQVTEVICTHPHGDHIKRNTLIEDGERKPTFPNARYHLGRPDWGWFSRQQLPEFEEHLATLDRLGMLTLVDGDTQIAPEVMVFPTPGHTPGHVSVLIESQGQTAIFLGDVFHLPVHFSHPEWVSTFDTHPEVTPKTRKEVIELALVRDALLVCPHAPAPGIGRVERREEGFSWQPID